MNRGMGTSSCAFYCTPAIGTGIPVKERMKRMEREDKCSPSTNMFPQEEHQCPFSGGVGRTAEVVIFKGP